MKWHQTNLFFIEYFGDLSRLRIIDFLIDNLVYDYSLVEIAKGASITYTTLIDILPDLIEKE